MRCVKLERAWAGLVFGVSERGVSLYERVYLKFPVRYGSALYGSWEGKRHCRQSVLWVERETGGGGRQIGRAEGGVRISEDGLGIWRELSSIYFYGWPVSELRIG